MFELFNQRIFDMSFVFFTRLNNIVVFVIKFFFYPCFVNALLFFLNLHGFVNSGPLFSIYLIHLFLFFLLYSKLLIFALDHSFFFLSKEIESFFFPSNYIFFSLITLSYLQILVTQYSTFFSWRLQFRKF